jgi:hypothetical protein
MIGIAATSAADVGYVKTQDYHTHTVQKNLNKQVNNVYILSKTTKTQTKVNKRSKFLKAENTTKKGNTQNKNTVKEISKIHITDSTKKVISNSKTPKSLTAKKVVKHSKKSVNKQNAKKVNKTSLKSASIENSVNLQVKNPITSVKSVPASKVATVAKKQKKYKVKKADNGKWNNSKYQYAAAGSKKKVRSKKARTSSVKALAASLSKGTKSKYTKAKKIFNWVRDNIRYKFYYNTKYGASGTLKKRAGNCVDHSHLIVALSRAAGLQAKYAHGKVRFPSGKTYGHVWALVKVNGKWYKADATSSRNSFGVMKGKVVRSKGVYNKLPF